MMLHMWHSQGNWGHVWVWDQRYWRWECSLFKSILGLIITGGPSHVNCEVFREGWTGVRRNKYILIAEKGDWLAMDSCSNKHRYWNHLLSALQGCKPLPTVVTWRCETKSSRCVFFPRADLNNCISVQPHHCYVADPKSTTPPHISKKKTK